MNEQLWKETAVGEWLDAEFEDQESGEVFFVELRKEAGESMVEFVRRCEEIAIDNFEEPEFLGLCDQKSAESLGYDTY